MSVPKSLKPLQGLKQSILDQPLSFYRSKKPETLTGIETFRVCAKFFDTMKVPKSLKPLQGLKPWLYKGWFILSL